MKRKMKIGYEVMGICMVKITDLRLCRMNKSRDQLYSVKMTANNSVPRLEIYILLAQNF